MGLRRPARGNCSAQRQPDGTPEPAAGNIDLETVESAGESWDGANLEVLAALEPDLVVLGGVDDRGRSESGSHHRDGRFAQRSRLVEVYHDTARAIIGNYERLAVALGVDPDSRRADGGEAGVRSGRRRRERSRDGSVPGLKVAGHLRRHRGLYIAEPVDFP